MSESIAPLRLIETEPGSHSLLLDAGSTKVDQTVDELGHEANGYFWEGIAQLLVQLEAPELDGRFDYDPEGSMFVAYGEDRAALEKLGVLMAAVADDPARMTNLVQRAKEIDFEFDD